MDVMLQRHKAKFIYAVPDGLRELMSDISREVLRSQPQYVYTFIADYLDALLITRENARIAARLVESIADIASTIANFLERTGMTRDDANKTVVILQTAFRKYLSIRPKARPNEQVEEQAFLDEVMEDIKILPEKAEEAAIAIQTAYRQFKERQEKQKEVLKGVIDWRIAARSAIYLYKKTGVTKEEAHRAATLIKAAYKGYYTRRTMRRIAEQNRMEEVEPEEEEEEEILYEETDDEYVRDEEIVYEEEHEGAEAAEVEEEKFLVVAEERSGVMVAEKLMEQILERVAQIADSVAAPPPSLTEPSAEATTTDLEGDTSGGEITDFTET